MRISLGNGSGFHDLALAQEFAERVLPLADWNTGSEVRANDTVAEQVIAIWNELIARDVAAANMVIAATYASLPRENRAARRRKRH